MEPKDSTGAVADEEVRVLLYEPDHDSREIIAELLEDAGLTAVTARTVEEAVDALHRTSCRVVVADLGPRDSDLEAARRLCHASFPIPVGVISTSRLAAEALLHETFAFCVQKPFAWESLLVSIAPLLAGAGAATALQESEQAIRRYFDALSRKDWGALVALCTEDVRYYLPGEGPFGVELHGRASLRQYAEAVFSRFPEARFDEVAAFALPEGTVARYVGRWRGEDGAPVSLAGAVSFRFRGTQICQVGIRIDQERLARLMSRGG